MSEREKEKTHRGGTIDCDPRICPRDLISRYLRPYLSADSTVGGPHLLAEVRLSRERTHHTQPIMKWSVMRIELLASGIH